MYSGYFSWRTETRITTLGGTGLALITRVHSHEQSSGAYASDDLDCAAEAAVSQRPPMVPRERKVMSAWERREGQGMTILVNAC